MFKKIQFSNIPSKRTGMIALISIIAILVSACGSSTVKPSAEAPAAAPTSAPAANSPASSDSNTQNACNLLSKEDVGKVLGQDVGDAVESGMGGVCTFTSKDLTFILTVSSTGGIKFMSETLAKLGDAAQVVPGLGDQAFYNSDSKTLFALKGDAVFLFNLNNSNYQFPENGQELQKALAEQLISKLS